MVEGIAMEKAAETSRSRDLQRTFYEGKSVALLTQHGKEFAIAPVLNRSLFCRVERVTGYDTDLLGTFTREIPRQEKQLDTARKKARIGMELSGLGLGVASEGSFGPDPYSGLIPWNVEIVVFIDDEHDLEVVGLSQGTAVFEHALIDCREDGVSFAKKIDFPLQQLVVRPEGKEDPRIRKGLSDWPSLEASMDWAFGESSNGRIFIETDLRAHANPSRMGNIRLATEDLAKKLSSFCPDCALPGFWILENQPGLPCQYCLSPTRQIQKYIYGCLKCNYRETKKREEYADPVWCDRCNP